MRPVRLEVNGFASFREPAVVDFTDADYFALVGPTGSGKSTILDAITFALYGTAHRWGRANAIANALAPTTNRCTVSLTFDVGPNRFQVAREVRRSGQQIQQKSVSLVRFNDPNDVAPGSEETQVLVGEVRELVPAIEDLLGLEFEDFCQCVVLPQGEFARFLTATSGERQKILLKLLGADQYEGLGKQAGSLAAKAGTEIDLLTDQLGRHAHSTPEAEADAQARVSTLDELVTGIDELAPQVREASTRSHEADTLVDRLITEIALLDEVAVPDGIEQLQRNATDAETTASTSRAAAEGAADALTQAAEAAKAGPQRAMLTIIQERYAERHQRVSRKGKVVDIADAAQKAADEARQTADAAAAAVNEARGADEQARLRCDRARKAYDDTSDRQRLLSRVHTPEGVGELAVRIADLDVVANTAEQTLEQARAAHAEASTALSTAPDPGKLADITADLELLAEVLTELAAASEAHHGAQTAEIRAADEVTARQQRLAVADMALDDARNSAGAARLRPHLQLGHACPVCEQTVEKLPAPVVDTALDNAEAARATVVEQLEAAQAAQRAAEMETRSTRDRVVLLTDRRERLDARLTTSLPDRPNGISRDLDADRAYLADETQDQARLFEIEQVAGAATREAESQLRDAVAGVAAMSRKAGQARGQVHTLLGSLSILNPPNVDTENVSAAWAQLEDWAKGQHEAVLSEVTAAADELDSADTARLETNTAVVAAEEQYGAAQGGHTAAVRDAAATAQERDALLHRLDELDTLLTGAPPAADLTGLLEEAAHLEAAVETGTTLSQQARAAANANESAALEWRSRVGAARSALTAARDKVAALEPPPVEGDNLDLSWTELAGWAKAGAQARAESTAAARIDRDAARTAVDQLLGEIDDLFTARGLDPVNLGAGSLAGPERVVAAQRVAAVSVERAKAQVHSIRKSLDEAEEVRGRIEEARERQQVASELASLMRSNKFPQWLADSALDTLVAGASDSLRRLSGEQFDLTHRRGEFFVIDHSDADSQRSVRTLSGGETFQASLALALSLSEHLTGMGGLTKLESIFLDEGFGTLDPDSLETVAATLENLAQGDRMVGVITHVPALAERVPVRFTVRRDSRTSHIERDEVR